jgi:hypothetical protein
MTSLIFPDSLGKGFELFSNGGTEKPLSLDVYQFKSSWSS